MSDIDKYCFEYPNCQGCPMYEDCHSEEDCYEMQEELDYEFQKLKDKYRISGEF